ncbi:sulfatase-like hydrolase/transferase [Paenibacillus sp. MWE-103]|uniref:Sulfatase-like hydrolase/transferase n=1 Tax=Paenibacillus artemisiicola TaxID=1172618 RepID=A0ABS3W7Y7_9BACL|nr:sulfatase-like hydrolase/transferase [Paenibacillus artemisiicola]MBO7744424.1 sulfatase-like hydrolase/transferase [Paenibacillus artemisiicola]
MTRPNIILITTDQQRYDSLGIHGSEFMRTPNMDRIGREGAVFTNAFCPNPVCTPSRVSMMTGFHLSRHGSYNIGTRPPDYSMFLSSILRQSGYRTHHIGKAHWHPWEAPSPETRKPDEAGSPFLDFAGFESAELSVGHATWGVQGHYASWLLNKGIDPMSYKVNRLFERDYYETGDWELPQAFHSGSWLAERAVDFLGSQAASQPFFLNLGFQDPHHPHVLPYDFENRVDPLKVSLPDTVSFSASDVPEHIPHFRSGTLIDSRFNGTFEMAGNGRYAWGSYFSDSTKARMTRAYYYSMIQLIDEQLGIILQALDDLGLADTTLLVFTSDHGEMLGDHGIGQKGPLTYNGVTHIPLLIRYPAGFKPCQIDSCVSLVDLLPTLLGFASIDDSIRRDGISLMTTLQARNPLERSGVRIEYKEEADRIRYKCWVTEDWKLALYPGETFGELYDRKRDADERRNLFNDPAYQEIKMKLTIELLGDLERSEPLNIRPSRV